MDIILNIEVFDDLVIILESDMSIMRGNNVEDVDDFVKYVNDGIFVILLVLLESFNLNNNNKFNKFLKKKVKDK